MRERLFRDIKDKELFLSKVMVKKELFLEKVGLVVGSKV